jgi:hypothetical protein
LTAGRVFASGHCDRRDRFEDRLEQPGETA